MAQTVKLRRSAIGGSKPTNAQIELGELAMNTTDGKVFMAKSGSGGPSVEELIVTNTINTGSINISGSINLEGDQIVTGSINVSDFIQFTNADSGSGYFNWDTTNRTMTIALGNGVMEQVGEEIFYPLVKNNTTETIPNGTPVMAAGSDGTYTYIVPAISDGSIPSEYYMGLTTEDIASGQTGFVTYFGRVNDLDTLSFTFGDILYVSDTTAGEMTTTPPSSPSQRITIGMVVKAHATTGIIFVRHAYIPKANEITYDNSGSTLLASNVASAIDELDATKASIGQLSSNISLYATTASGDFGYYRLTTTTVDPDFPTIAIDVPTGPINTTSQLIATLISDENIINGNPGVINISTVGNIAKTSGNSTQYAEFYFELYHRDSGGTETLIASSTSTGAINPADSAYYEFSATALLNNGIFTPTDRVVIKFLANILNGTNPTYNFQFGGNNPVRTLLPVPVSVLPSAYASDILVDTANFDKILSGVDDNVQQALETLDEHDHDGHYLSSSGGTVTGDVVVDGSLNVTGWITGSLLGSASYATLSTSASYALNATSASFANNAGQLGGQSPSYYSSVAYTDQRWELSHRRGFVDRSEFTYSFDSGTYTFSIVPTGSSFRFMFDGKVYTVSGTKSIQIANPPVDGQRYYITISDSAGNLAVSNSVWAFTDNPVAVIYYHSGLSPSYIILYEAHTMLIDSRLHEYLHQTQGTKHISGAVLSGYTTGSATNTANTFGMSEAIIVDEDIDHTVTAIADGNGANATNYMTFYRNGIDWEWLYSDMPFSYTTNGYINWDNAGTLTQGTGGAGGSIRYYNTFVLLTNSYETPFKTIILLGQHEYTTAEAAYGETLDSLDLTGFPAREWVAMYQLTWQTGLNILTNKGKVVLNREPELLETSALSVSNVSTQLHNLLSGLQGGNGLDQYYHLTLDDYLEAIAFLDSGSYTHTQVDAHIDDETIHFAHVSGQTSVDNSQGTVIQDILMDTYGHISGTSSINLDARFVNVTGDTMTGNLIVSGNITSTGNFLGNLTGTASYATTASYALTATSSSYALNASTASYITYANVANTPTIGNGTLTLSGSAGVSGSGVFSANQTSNTTITLVHADTSTQNSSDNSGNTVIQDITLDTYGHVTALGTATISSVTSSSYATNADTLDNLNSSQFLRSDTSDIMTGNLTITGSLLLSGSFSLKDSVYDYQENLTVTTGSTQVIATVSASSYDAAFFDYVIKSGTNLRAGSMVVIQDGISVEYNETSTIDLGDTSDVSLSADLNGGNIRLLATTLTDNWEIKSLVRAL